MSSLIGKDHTSDKLANNIERLAKENASSIERLSSGQIFTSQDPLPSEQALADRLEFKMRSLAASKQNISNGVSLLQTADSSLSQINNIIQRMKEINIAAASDTSSDRERSFLFIEFDALQKEIDRIAETTEFNGLRLINGADENTPEELIIRLNDPGISGKDESLNTVRLPNLRNITASNKGLGLPIIAEELNLNDPIDIDEAIALMEPSDEYLFDNIYDEAIDKISDFRSQFGSIQTRLQKAHEFQTIVEENFAAAKSKIADTDYAHETAKLARNNILMQASSSLLNQNNFHSAIALQLINSVV
jgi:flagellin